MIFSSHSCQQLELQLQSNRDQLSLNTVETQCFVDKYDQITQTTDGTKSTAEVTFNSEIDSLKTQNNVLHDEIDNLNFQLSTFIIQRQTTESVRKTIFSSEKLFNYKRKTRLVNRPSLLKKEIKCRQSVKSDLKILIKANLCLIFCKT